MGGVFRDVTMAWGGVDYTFTPSNRLLRTIEGGGANVVQLMTDLARGEVKVSALAYVAACFFRAGGAAVTEDDVYGALMNGNPEETQAIAVAVAQAITPQGAGEKKPEAPGKSTPRAKPKKRPAKSTGQTST